MIKKLRKILPIVILISIGLGVMQVNDQFMVQGVLPVSSYIGENMIWDVTNITSGNIEWWNWSSTLSFEANWHASIGDQINLTITSSAIINDKPHLVGDFKFGNLSLATNNYDIGSNLALSCYPWVGGLITLEPDWDDLSNQSPFNGTSASIETDLAVAIVGLEGIQYVTAVRILYNDGFQKSTFFYEQTTGIFLWGDTNVGSFWFSLNLNDTSISLPTTTTHTSDVGYGIISTVVIGCLSLLIIKKKRK